jgi:hypothetical protein
MIGIPIIIKHVPDGVKRGNIKKDLGPIGQDHGTVYTKKKG